jgi:Na+:H+ antiporter, NhaC family
VRVTIELTLEDERRRTDPEPPRDPAERIGLVKAGAPVLLLIVLIVHGMILTPKLLNQEAWPLEFIFLAAALGTILLLFAWRVPFAKIQESIQGRTRTALPAIYMLMVIGVLIGSWTAAGTIPMLVHYGMLLIDPSWLYLVAFLLTSLFSVLTGTSWGSAGTIGVVLINIGMASDAHLGLLAGAIISGAYFGDKMSPLSDTTNMAAMGAGTPLYSHVRSMMNTTFPAYLISAVIYVVLVFALPTSGSDVASQIRPTVDALAAGFSFNPLVLLPVVVVAVGAVLRKPPLPTMLISSAVAAATALIVQGLSVADIVGATISGFTGDMLITEIADERAIAVIERGGLYSMASAVIITLCVFMYIGALDVIDAMGTVVRTVFGKVTSRPGTIIASLLSSAVVNGFTSNQYATSFIVGDAFGRKYDDARIPRQVLSRSIEDYGTSIEPMLPWTTTGIYMVATLGVAYSQYVPFLFLQMLGFVIAPLLAITGIGCFYGRKRSAAEKAAMSAAGARS